MAVVGYDDVMLAWVLCLCFVVSSQNHLWCPYADEYIELIINVMVGLVRCFEWGASPTHTFYGQ